MGEDMKFLARFEFDKRPCTLDSVVQPGDDVEFTLNGKLMPYHCDLNELLVIRSVKVKDPRGMLRNVYIRKDGALVEGNSIGVAIEPDEYFSVEVRIKSLKEMHIQQTVIDYLVEVEIEATQYLVKKIEGD